jgi:hypothetical protein
VNFPGNYIWGGVAAVDHGNGAPGAAKTIVIPAGYVQKIDGARCTLITDGTSVNRTVRMLFTWPGATSLYTFTDQTVGSTATRVHYFEQMGNTLDETDVEGTHILLPQGIWLYEGCLITWEVNNIQAADQLQNCATRFRSWQLGPRS